ncbi:MAG: helix-turn-helix domain-containing protein [Anaerovoracaceae bacterium]
MLTVMDLLSHPNLKEFRLVTNKSGLSNQVLNSGIFEWEQAKDIKEGFGAGDFIMTTLSPYRNNQPQAEFFLKLLMDTKPAAIAIKEIYYDHISDELIDYANLRRIPIFFFREVFFDDIVFTIKSSLTPSNINTSAIQTIRKILYEDMTPYAIEASARSINRFFSDRHMCALLMPHNHGDDSLITSLTGYTKDPRFEYNSTEESAFSIHKFSTIVGIIFTTKNPNLNIKQHLSDLINSLPIKKGTYHIGYSQICNSLSKLNFTYKEAMYSSVEALYHNLEEISFDNIGLTQFLCPLRNDYWVKNYFDTKYAILEDNDKANNGHLIETAFAFIQNQCNYNKTGEALFQHSNTIRYRINKVHSLLGLDNTLDPNGQLALIMKQHKINSILYHSKI